METRSATTIGTAVGLIWAAALVAGCGGDTGGVAASCGKVLPCGGSLTGTWTVSSSCESATDLTGGNACPAATIDESQLVASGTLTFNADMTFVSNTSQSGTRRFSVPLDCLGSISSSCDEFASLISRRTTRRHDDVHDDGCHLRLYHGLRGSDDRQRQRHVHHGRQRRHVDG